MLKVVNQNRFVCSGYSVCWKMRYVATYRILVENTKGVVLMNDAAWLNPENLKIVSAEEGKLSGTVLFIDYLGDSNIVNLDIENQIIKAKVSDSDLHVGSKTSITFNDDDIILFDDNGNLVKWYFESSV